MSNVDYILTHGMQFEITNKATGEKGQLNGVAWVLTMNGEKEFFFLDDSSAIYDASAYTFARIYPNKKNAA